MTGIYPPVAREIKGAIARLKRATSRDELRRHAKDASELVKRELVRTERDAVVALTKVKNEREQLLELLTAVNETLKEKLDEFK